MSDDFYCEYREVKKKEGPRLDEEDVNKAYVEACSSNEEGSHGSFAFRVEEGNRTVHVKVFNPNSQLYFSCMKEKTVV